MVYLEKLFQIECGEDGRYPDLHYHYPKANDRRKAIRHLFGSWFDDRGYKLTRDYMVTFHHLGDNHMPPLLYSWSACVEIRNPDAAVIFKLTWC